MDEIRRQSSENTFAPKWPNSSSCWYERDRYLNAPVRVLLEADARLYEAELSHIVRIMNT
jgi:hypothetical protein